MKSVAVDLDTETRDIALCEDNDSDTYKKECFIRLDDLDMCYEDDIDARKAFNEVLEKEKRQKATLHEIRSLYRRIRVTKLLAAYELEELLNDRYGYDDVPNMNYR